MTNFSKINFLLCGLICFLFSSANAGITQGQVEIILNNKEIVTTPKKGFHINDKAPASAIFDEEKIKAEPSTKTEKKIVFTIPSDAKKVQLKFYVCDDAKTVCEQQSHDVDLKAKSKDIAASQTPIDSGKPTLLVFSAPWCPACIRLKSETLNQTSIKKLLKKVYVTYLNIDLVENETISKKYNVKAIPTMILLGKTGNEVNRWLDFQLVAPFSTELSASLNLSDLEQTEKMAELGDQKAIRRRAENAFSQMQWAEATKWYSLSKNSDDLQKKLYAEINKTKDDKDDDKTKTDEYLKTLVKATSLSQSKFDKQMWTIDYFEQIAEDEKPMSEDNKAAITKTINELNTLVNSPQQMQAELKKSIMTGLYGLETMEALDIMARGYDLLKDDAAKKQVQERMYKLAAAKKINMNQPGIVIHVLYYMSQADHMPEAEALTKKLIERYPKTYVYYDRYAKMLLKAKRFEEALAQVDSALTYKEGNEPQLNLVKTKILVGLKKTDDAISLVDQTMKIIEPYPDKYKRTKASLVSIKTDLTKK